jgi:hypothetical protein
MVRESSTAPSVVTPVRSSLTRRESLASRCGGWTYTDAPLGWVGHAPLFIVVAEAAMFASAYYWVRRESATGGIGIGLTIIASYAGVYYLFTRLAAMA